MRNISILHLLFFLTPLPVFAADAPAAAIQTLDTPRVFPEITTRAQWQERSRAIREQILVSSGLWPMPEKAPLQAVVSGKIVRDGYSVEKVYFQSYPGFYVAGNLYRPLGRGAGPFPAILNPHGHWAHGRLEDTDVCSSAGRCINFAKQGMIALAYDMVGYNDTHFSDSPRKSRFGDSHHSFASNGPATLLWSVTLMGLQTWDSIRALDFLESLPDVDKTRLACTGESGGGTQTMILGAIDDRLAAQAPVVMVSHTMQGGCVCENMPGLRVQFSNMEIAASVVPRPQILVADNTDWTKTTLAMEGPAIKHIYELFQTPENLRYVLFEAVHNYNQTSRQAVYQWFDRWLLHQADQPVVEQAFQKEPDQDLLVFPDGKLPADAVTQKDLVKYLIQTHRDQLQAITPTNESSLGRYKLIMEPAWRRTLQLDVAGRDDFDTNKMLHFKPPASHDPSQPVIVLAHPDGKGPFVDNAEHPIGLAKRFLDRGYEVVILDERKSEADPDQTSLFFTAYNRTRLQEKVRDLISICATARSISTSPKRHVVLCGCGRSGLWALLAAPAADAVIADCGQLDVSDDQVLLDPDLFCPGIRNIDTFAGAAILAAPHPLVLHNVANGFPVIRLRSCYHVLRAETKLKMESQLLNDDDIVASVLALDGPAR